MEIIGWFAVIICGIWLGVGAVAGMAMTTAFSGRIEGWSILILLGSIFCFYEAFTHSPFSIITH